MTTNPTHERGYNSLPIPFGWFGVAMSDEIAKGEIKTMRYFGTEFVMWRGHDGVLNAVDPFCPHLGAHHREPRLTRPADDARHRRSRAEQGTPQHRSVPR